MRRDDRDAEITRLQAHADALLMESQGYQRLLEQATAHRAHVEAQVARVQQLVVQWEDWLQAHRGHLEHDAVAGCAKELAAVLAALEAETLMSTESKMVEAYAVLEALEGVLVRGEEPSDFMTSFPLVQTAIDLRAAASRPAGTP